MKTLQEVIKITNLKRSTIQRYENDGIAFRPTKIGNTYYYDNPKFFRLLLIKFYKDLGYNKSELYNLFLNEEINTKEETEKLIKNLEKRKREITELLDLVKTCKENIFSLVKEDGFYPGEINTSEEFKLILPIATNKNIVEIKNIVRSIINEETLNSLVENKYEVFINNIKNTFGDLVSLFKSSVLPDSKQAMLIYNKLISKLIYTQSFFDDINTVYCIVAMLNSENEDSDLIFSIVFEEEINKYETAIGENINSFCNYFEQLFISIGMKHELQFSQKIVNGLSKKYSDHSFDPESKEWLIDIEKSAKCIMNSKLLKFEDKIEIIQNFADYFISFLKNDVEEGPFVKDVYKATMIYLEKLRKEKGSIENEQCNDNK